MEENFRNLLDQIEDFQRGKASFNELGLMRYFCDLIKGRYEKLGSLNALENEMRELIDEPVNISIIGRLRGGIPARMKKPAYVKLMDYAGKLNQEIPSAILSYYNNLMKEDL
ncbi:MAG: hypothetical protein V3W18_03370 [candidate division Zixibacteria bacterium]